MNESAQSNVTTAESAGAILHAERRRQNLSLGDVSRHLKISVRQVEALERDDFQPFAGSVFVHGFIRNYAKLLGVDAEPLVRAADLKLAPPVPEQSEFPRVVHRESERSQGRNLAAVGLIAVMLIMGFVGFYSSKRSETDPPPPPLNALRSPLLPQEAAKQAEPPPPAATPAAKAAVATSVAAGTAVTSVAAGTAATSVAAGAGVLRMVFDQESWVEVKDRSGNTIFAQLNPVGARRDVTGEPPLSLVVGNAPGVRLSYNDREIDLRPHTRVAVARLTLE